MRKYFIRFLSIFFPFLLVFCSSELNYYVFASKENIISFDYKKQESLSSSEALNSSFYIAFGYLALNALLRIATKLALFPGTIINKNEKKIDYDDQIIEETIFEEDRKGNSVSIGKKITAVKGYDCSLKNIDVIFFNGNGGSVLGDELHLGPNGKLIYLAKKGATIYSIDYRGYGNRDLLLGPFSMSESSIFEDGENVLNYVMGKSKNEKIILYGYSMGGQVVLHVWNYMQNNGLEDKLAAVILHSPLNNFNKVAGKFWKPLEWLLNLMFINLRSLKEFDKIHPTDIPSYWYSGYTDDNSEFVDLLTTIGNSSKKLSREEARNKIKNKLKEKRINNATVVLNNASHVANYSNSPETDEESNELEEFKKFIQKISNNQDISNDIPTIAA